MNLRFPPSEGGGDGQTPLLADRANRGEWNRTTGILYPVQALSPLSYTPSLQTGWRAEMYWKWCGWLDLNQRDLPVPNRAL